MRMARLIQSRQEDVQITFFYIDVQTFGKDFPRIYRQIDQNMTMVRAIPGEITLSADNDLLVTCFDPQNHESLQDAYDLVILSVGLLPCADSQRLADMLGVSTTQDGFMPPHGSADDDVSPGIFFAGSVMGPMTIAESVGSAEKAAFDVARYLELE